MADDPKVNPPATEEAEARREFLKRVGGAAAVVPAVNVAAFGTQP